MAALQLEPTPEAIEAQMELIKSQRGWSIDAHELLNKRLLQELGSGELLRRIREASGERQR